MYSCRRLHEEKLSYREQMQKYAFVDVDLPKGGGGGVGTWLGRYNIWNQAVNVIPLHQEWLEVFYFIFIWRVSKEGRKTLSSMWF